MTSGRLLARNTAISLSAHAAPLVIAVVAVPILIEALGPGRFGVLTLAWALIGYFGLFDFGIGRALTQSASEALGRGDNKRLVEVSSIGMGALFVLGVISGVLFAALTPWLVFDVLKMDDALRPEAARAFYLLSVSLPFVFSTAGYRGLLEAHQHFGLATALRMPYAIFTFVGPLFTLPLSNSLVAIVGVLVFGRMATWIAHAVAARRRYPWLSILSVRNPAAIAPLLRLGGWMSVSNFVSPLMVNIDRFLIGAIMSMAAVAFYVTPYEVVTKLLFIPAAIVAVFFPAFAATYVHDRGRTAVTLDRATRLLTIAVFPATLVFVAIGREALALWVGPELGPEFGRQGSAVLQILAIGVFINSLAQAPFSLLQAIGRPDLTAKLHLAELPVYAAMILFFADRFGLPGVALAWTARIVIDTAVLLWLARDQFPEASASLMKSTAWVFVLTGALVVVALAERLSIRVGLGAVTLFGFAVVSWSRMLDGTERRLILDAVPWADKPATRGA